MNDEMGWASNVIDPEVYLEWQSALNKAGMTFALKKAYERLPVLLSMKPETVEAYFATRLDETLL
jgi:hypothetical protein